MWAEIEKITVWLDEMNAGIVGDDAMRILKLTEEAGEAAAAFIGVTGQNPRKGVTHTLDDLLGELADVAITAMCAIQHFTKDIEVTHATLQQKLEHIVKRAGLDKHED